MSRDHQRRSYLGLTLVSIWLLFTVSLVGWWIYFGLSQVDRLIQIQHESSSTLVRYQKMLVYEGCVMLLCIVLGGGALIYYIYREMRETKRLQQFFAAFTHQIKTPLASARLKSEILKERIQDPENISLINKVLSDVGRLSLQLENSLFLADEGKGELFIEKINLTQLLTSFGDFWPDLKIECPSNCVVHGDKRILEAVVANILQNAVSHGKAEKIVVTVYEDSQWQTITFSDNGRGFSGEYSSLGHLFKRHYSGSGSGIGIHVIKQLLTRMGGMVSFPSVTEGFSIAIKLKRVV